MELFKKYNFQGIVFGHALSGNVHFIITPNLNDKEVARIFAEFMEELAQVVSSFQGSIKAEHGTGRMVAPFVELEWGKKAYRIHQRIKEIFDAENLFNPDVILSEDKEIHRKNLKPSLEHYDVISELIGKCMECGFCEKYCPTLAFTLTPRQRISVYQEIRRLETKEGLSLEEQSFLEELKLGYQYFVLETCATCSMCANLCPLQIDTAKIAKLAKIGKHEKIAQFVAKNFKPFSATLKHTVKVANFTQTFSKTLSKSLNQWIKTPVVLDYFPRENQRDSYEGCLRNFEKQVVYFSSCLNRIFAPPKEARDKRSIQDVFESLCLKAKIDVIYPQNIQNLCCSKAFKDYRETAKQVALETFRQLRLASKDGEIMIVCDHSACALELLERAREFGVLEGVNLNIKDMPIFVLENIIPQLTITKKDSTIGLYAPCSTRHYSQRDDNEKALLEIAKMCAREVRIHSDTKCCGFAGNKGFLNPTLNQHALKGFVRFYARDSIEEGYSSSSTCEVGLSANTQRVWQHIVYLLDSCT